MKKNTLDVLIEGNEFPIVFIGSGISKRYLESYPKWIELLQDLWMELGNSEDFYGYLNKFKQDILRKGEISESLLNFKINTTVATELEYSINDAFYNDKIHVEGFSQEDAFRSNISPFKKLLSNKFVDYKLLDSKKEEFQEFKKMLMKAQIILTTNYDALIEDSYNVTSKYRIKKYIGQRGFFEHTYGYAELYKFHGCATDPNSLVITTEDYEKFDRNSILISSKIISMLLYSPIIFIGYSLSDRNVRTIIKNFVDSLSNEELILLEKRLIIIERKEGEDEVLEEVINDSELGCRLTVLKTDNYKEIYNKICKINQGVAPSEVRRYQHVIKELIVKRGKEGTLSDLLISPDELDNIEKIMGNKNIVVAIGDSKIIFAMPNIVTYIYDYIDEETEQNLDIMLRFIASQATKARLPFIKYLSEESLTSSNVNPVEKEKLRFRLKVFNDINRQIKSIPKSYNEEYDKIDYIVGNNYNEDKECNLIAFNIERLDINEIRHYILKKLNEMKESGEFKVSTALRRLTLIYDLKKNTCIL